MKTVKIFHTNDKEFLNVLFYDSESIRGCGGIEAEFYPSSDKNCYEYFSSFIVDEAFESTDEQVVYEIATKAINKVTGGYYPEFLEWMKAFEADRALGAE
jgi:hypothetical protein